MKFNSIILLLVNAAMVAKVAAWNGEGHLLIARMAYDIIKSKNPAMLEQAETLLRVYSDDLTKQHERDYPFVECVTLPDDNKRRGGGWQSTWHFNDKGFVGDNTPASDYNFGQTDKNITMALPSIFTWLTGGDAKSTIAYQTVMKHVNSEEEGKSLALRLFIHYMGDVHQPLHCSDRYTQEFPKGDKGGNTFLLKNHYSANELHAVWDNVIYQYHKNPVRPFTKDTWADFGALATDLVGQFKFDSSMTDTTDFLAFSEESYEIAVDVYTGLKEGKTEVVPQEYINKYGIVAKKRVVLAAHRLVYAIEQIFSNSTPRVQASQEFDIAQKVKSVSFMQN